MSSADRFLIKSLIAVFIISLLLLIAYFFSVIPEEFFTAVLIADSLAVLNYFSGLICIKIGLKGSQDTFFKATLGGMGIRLLVMLLLVFISLTYLNINRNSFIFSILFFYILYLIFELIYLYMKKI